MQIKSLNRVILVGYIANDPEKKETKSGHEYAKITVATNSRYKTKNGEYRNTTEWNKCLAFRTVASFINLYLKKGDLVMVEGELKTRKWVYQDKPNYMTEILVERIQVLDAAEYKANYNDKEKGMEDIAKYITNDNDESIIDLPF